MESKKRHRSQEEEKENNNEEDITTEKVPMLEPNYFKLSTITKEECTTFSSLIKENNTNSFFTSSPIKQSEIKEENPFLFDSSYKKNESPVILTSNSLHRYQIDNAWEYSFLAKEYVSKGKGFSALEVINDKNYFVFRNVNLQIIIMGEIVKNTTTFDISKNNNVVGVINKMITVEEGKLKPCSYKLKFNSKEGREQFKEEFTKMNIDSKDKEENKVIEGKKEIEEKPKGKISTDSQKPKRNIKIICVKHKTEDN